jgi:hypothetical protein
MRETWEDWVVGEPHINQDRSIQAVLRDGASAAAWWNWLSQMAHPTTLVVGFGFGQLFGQREPDGRVLVGGPALDRARSALWQARRERRLAAVGGIGEVETAVLASLLELLATQRQGWTRRQAQTIALARTRSGREVARELGVGASVVSESLSAAGFRASTAAEAALRDLMSCYGSATSGVDGILPRFPELTAPAMAEATG